jgi:hypothetical protein
MHVAQRAALPLVKPAGGDVAVLRFDLELATTARERPLLHKVIDRIRELAWPGVFGNTDEMLWMPHRVSDTLHAPHLHRIRDLILTYTIPATLDAIGDERVAWLRSLPRRWSEYDVTLVHSTPDDVWPITHADGRFRSRPGADLRRARVEGRCLWTHSRPLRPPAAGPNRSHSGAVSQSFDGDRRAAYALLDGDAVEIKRVEYDVEGEV